MKNIKKLPESELKVMMAIWDNTPPVSRSTLSSQLKDQNWTDPTILSLLGRLVKKGFLSCDKQGNKNVYTPLITKEEYMVKESVSFAQKINNISITGLMAAFVKENGITQKEIEELEKMINQYKNTK